MEKTADGLPRNTKWPACANTSASTSVLFLSLAVLAIPLNDDFATVSGFELTGYNAALSNLRPVAPEALTDAKQVESITIFNSNYTIYRHRRLAARGQIKVQRLG